MKPTFYNRIIGSRRYMCVFLCIVFGLLVSYNTAQCQYSCGKSEIIETAFGLISVVNEDGNNVSDATVTFSPVNIPGDSIPAPYEFLTDHYGIATYEVLVFHENSVGVSESLVENSFFVSPSISTDFTFYYYSELEPTVPVVIRDLNGRTVFESFVSSYENKNAVYYTDLSELDDGVYIASILDNGHYYTNKIVKVDDEYHGVLGSVKSSATGVYKDVMTHEAVYDISIEADGYYVLSDQLSFSEGNQGISNYTLIEEITVPVPQYQYIGGSVLDEEGIAMPNVMVWIKDLENDMIISQTLTQENGEYLLPEPVPVNSNFYFGVGGIEGKYTFVGDEYTVPEELFVLDDTLNCNFKYVLYDKLRSPPDDTSITEMVHAWKFRSLINVYELNLNISLRDSLYFYINPEFSYNEKTLIRQRMVEFAEMIGLGNVIESYSELNCDTYYYNPYTNYNGVGININDGNGNGHPVGINIFEAPLGLVKHAAFAGEIFCGPSGKAKFIHELGHAINLWHVDWNETFMLPGGPSPLPFTSDKIMMNMSLAHSEKLWTGQVYFDLKNIQEAFSQYEPCEGNPYVFDDDNNMYHTVQIGDQCWMKSNLNTGVEIDVSEEPANNDVVEKYCLMEDYCIHGGFYTWEELMNYEYVEGGQGICPDGWHVPSDNDWKILEGYVDSQYEVGNSVWNNTGWRGLDVGRTIKQDKYFNGWDIFELGLYTAGRRVLGDIEIGEHFAYYWTSSEDGQGLPIYRHFHYDEDRSYRDSQDDEYHGYAVRCLKD